MILLNPGPVTLSSRVRNAMLREDLCHREKEFGLIQGDIRRRLVEVYDDCAQNYEAVLVTGSGTSAVEMMVGSLVPKSGKALIVANGVYGERMAAMVRAQSKSFDLLQADWLAPLPLKEVEAHLRNDASISHVLSVHHETTTGRLNDIAALGELCRTYDKSLLLDAVSSFGAEELCFEQWNLEACAATANKCLHGVPGMSFVVAKTSSLRRSASEATSVYLDLNLQYREQIKGSSAFTHAVQACYAFQEALCEFKEQGGWKSRREQYRTRSEEIRQALSSCGVSMLLPDASYYSCILSSFLMPSGRKSYEQLHDFLKSNGFIIYAGQGRFNSEIFRVAVMGAMNSGDLRRLNELFGRFFSVST